MSQPEPRAPKPITPKPLQPEGPSVQNARINRNSEREIRERNLDRKQPQLSTGSRKRAGPKYDNALRGLIDKQPTAIAEFVTRSHLDGAVAIFGNTELPGTTLRVDTLIETSQRRFQIEFQHRANAREFEPRLVSYWSRLHDLTKPALEQHAIVLDPKGGRLTGQYDHGGLSLSYTAHHLWDYPAEELLKHPSLYPLAILGAAGNREQILRLIIEKARSFDNNPTDHPNSSGELNRGATASDSFQTISIALTLASVHLSPGTIEDILERTNMTVLFTDLPLGKELLRRGRKLGLEQGLEQGREVVLALAEQRFGSLPKHAAVALRDSKLSLKDLTNLVLAASSISELQTSLAA
jgi:hypothetical protein